MRARHVRPHSLGLSTVLLLTPGGPNNSTPRHGSRMPVNISGTNSGNATASFSMRLAESRHAMSSKLTPGLLIHTHTPLQK